MDIPRPYVANMLPCIVKIAKREDDSVQESLGVMMQKVVPVLGIFMSEGDVKVHNLPLFIGAHFLYFLKKVMQNKDTVSSRN